MKLETEVSKHRSPCFTRKLLAPIALPVLLLGLAPSAWAYTYTLRPAADTTAKQALPNNNYGTNTALTIRNTATGQGEFSFLRFTVPALAGNVTSATLTLRVTGAIQEAGYYSVAMGNPTWPETWLTWNNWQTGTTYTYLGSQHNLVSGNNTSFSVTGWVGSGERTFAVASSADITGQRFSSKEGSVRPTLTVVTDGSLKACTVGELKAELDHILKTGNLLYACDYKPKLSPTFTSWNGSSENWPVVAAAIALFDGPIVNGTDYRIWWQNFFNQQASTSGSGHINYFKGSELFSNAYDATTTTGVLAARFWSHVNGHSTIKSLAADYLRRTWYAWALATSPQAFDSVWRNIGSTREQVALKYTGQDYCPTLALASPRSSMRYDGDDKRWLLAKVLGYSQTCFVEERMKRVVDYVVGQYPDVSGLTSTERSSLQALINNTTIPGNLSTVLGAVRMERDFHWLLWSDGRRATYYIGHQLNNNINVGAGIHTVYTALFNRSTLDLDLLFAEGKNNVSCIDPGSRRVFVDDQSLSGCSSTHWITLPPDNPTHHFVLGPSGWRTCSSLSC
ncbi:MAG TPA: DNRLRE domain-containing protein [Thermoanaerobaculia bacterium]|nr:DNRLRE domain-containing protein [Thermoanaerobaculia bacterium]